MMDGHMSLTSEVGKGSCFRLHFPEVLLSAAPEQDTDTTATVDRLDQVEPSTILYADEQELNRILMNSYFEQTGHTLLLASNGKEAVEMAARHQPDLILMDIRMPVMNGIEATRRIKKKSDIPVVAVTASSMKDDQEEQHRVCNMVLSKPVGIGDLAKALKAFLPLRETPSEEEAVEASRGVEDAGDEKPPSETLARWPELLDRLGAERDGDWPDLCDTPNMADVEAFAKRLNEYADTYSARPLSAYAERLRRQVEEFDIENLSTTLKAFPQIIETIEKQVEPE
jgi:CheY-like chemotaxis protein